MVLKDRKCYYILMIYLSFNWTEGKNLWNLEKNNLTFSVLPNTNLTLCWNILIRRNNSKPMSNKIPLLKKKNVHFLLVKTKLKMKYRWQIRKRGTVTVPLNLQKERYSSNLGHFVEKVNFGKGKKGGIISILTMGW